MSSAGEVKREWWMTSTEIMRWRDEEEVMAYGTKDTISRMAIEAIDLQAENVRLREAVNGFVEACNRTKEQAPEKKLKGWSPVMAYRYGVLKALADKEAGG